MSKDIHFGNKAREALKSGVDKVADAVRVTIGPRGRNAVIDKGYGTPTITNDGVSIAKEIELKDKFENMGAAIVKEVANRTNDQAGDGTTTATVLTQAIVDEGFKRAAMGVSAMGLKSGIEHAAGIVTEVLKKMTKAIKDKDEIVQVATISAESSEFGKIIAEAIDKVGKDGVVTVEESQSFGVTSEVVEGMQFDKGYVSPYMITDSERMEATYEDVSILITDKKISSIKEILPILEKLAAEGKKDLVIIAEDVDGEALATLVVNKLRSTFNTLVVKSPGFGDKRKDMLTDIAILTGAKVVSEEAGQKLDTAELTVLGRAHRVVASKDNTTLVGGRGEKSQIEARVASLRKQLEESESKYDKEKLQERIGKLAGGVAVIKVGAATETEMKYKKLKIEDAVNATKAAIDEGIVPGGGSVLVHVQKALEGKEMQSPNPEAQAEFSVGAEILVKALSAPLKQIAVNAGKDDGSVIVDKVKEMGPGSGYDANADKLIDDMYGAGIIDPAKVTRAGVEHAASAAATLLTTEVAITDAPEPKAAPDPHDHGHSHGGGMPGMF